MEKIKNLHKGHRQRLKDKVRNHSLKALSEHEVLELLLTYTIPQKDTNGLAHMLINQFGNISSVLDSGYKELLKVNGIGDETALFLSILPDLVEIYKSSKGKGKTLTIRNTIDCVNYFRQNFEIHPVEYLYIVCVNQVGKIIKTITFKGENGCKIQFDIKDLTEKISNVNTYSVIMYHTHPDGELEPSKEDIDTTQRIMYLCALLGIVFCDHIIFNETNHYSLGCEGKLDKLFDNVLHAFPKIPNNHIRIQQSSKFEYKDLKE